MRNRSAVRDIAFTAIIFLGLIAGTFVLMIGEKFLDNFKSH